MRYTSVFRLLKLRLSLIGTKLAYYTGGIESTAQYIRQLPDPAPALRQFGAQIGTGTKIYPGLTVHAAERDFSNLLIGSDVRIVRDCLVDLTDRVEIGSNAIVSFRCSLITHMNIHLSPLVELGYAPVQGPIIIGPGAVLFANVTVLHDITIGEGAIVAAGAVVTKDVPAWTLVGGVPAREIKQLDTGPH